jgi:hypothetical protein
VLGSDPLVGLAVKDADGSIVVPSLGRLFAWDLE